MQQSKQVRTPQLQMRIMSVKVDGTGTASLSGTCSNNFVLVDNGTGDYNINPVLPFRRAPEIVATAITDNIYCKVGTVSVSGIQVLTENLSGSATDADFHLIVLGSDSPDQI